MKEKKSIFIKGVPWVCILLLIIFHITPSISGRAYPLVFGFWPAGAFYDLINAVFLGFFLLFFICYVAWKKWP